MIAHTFLWAAALVALEGAKPPFDGVLRPNGEGRLDAYLPPPFPSSHASMVEQTSGGRLHMAWFSGTGEGNDGVSIVHASLDTSAAEEGARWSSAQVISRRKGFSNQNAVLFFNGSTLHAFHSQQPANKGESKATVWYLSAPVAADGSADNFSKPVEVFPTPGTFDKNRVLALLDGSWLLPLYFTGGKPNYEFNKRLPPHADPADPKAWRSAATCSGVDNLVQASIVRLKPTEPALVAFFRDRLKRNIYWCQSDDDGAHWGAATPTDLPNNNAGIHAWVLRSGRIALVYNPQHSSRDPIAISISEDGGRSWKYTRTLEYTDGRQEYSYPTVREDVSIDGRLHVSYTWRRETIKHSIISEEWVMDGTPTRSISSLTQDSSCVHGEAKARTNS